MKKRVLGILLTVCMMLSIIPAPVVAVGPAEVSITNESAVTEAVDSDGDGYVEIDTAAKLWWFTQQVNGGNNSLNAELTANIDLAGTCGEGIGNWLPIGNNYSGHFNGQGYTISNLYMSGNDQYVGLFGYVSGGTIENVNLTGSISSTFSFVDNFETYEYYTGAAGGIVAYLDGGTIRNCESDVTVAGGFEFGGICGRLSSGIIEDCINRGTIIRDLDSTDVVYCGGIVGYMSDGTVRGCINQGADIVGAYAEIGGIAGQVAEGTVENCVNLGNIVTTQYTSAGGIAGKIWIYGAIRNCGNTGTVTGTDAGGITGFNEGIIEHCWNIASVSGISGTSRYVGPIAGLDREGYGTSTNNYYLSDTTTEDGGRTAEQFASGQVAYELNGSTTTDDSVWKQTLGTDSYPTLTGDNVYYVTSKKCDDTVIGQIYSNSSEDVIVHEDTDSDSFCDLCEWLIITEITFPDETFRGIISTYFDDDGDGLLSPKEIASVTTLWWEQRGLTDITGVNYFTELTEIYAWGNDLKTLDLSGLSKLEYLFLQTNRNLTSLNLEGCYSLIDLDLSGCYALTFLNISDCTALKYLSLSHCYKLKDSLDVSHLTELTYLCVDDVYLLELDLSANTKLQELLIHNTGLTSLDLSNTAVYRLEGYPIRNIEHCGVGYVNMNLYGDVTKMVNITGGTMGEDGWLKLNEYVYEITYEYVTGAEGCNLPVTIGFNPNYAELHAFVGSVASKDETHHYTEVCEICRTENEATVAEHTDSNGDAICDICADFTFPGTGTEVDPYQVDTFDELVAACIDNAFVKLAGDIEWSDGDGNVIISGTTHLCLNGYTLDLANSHIRVFTDGVLTICNCAEGAGSITAYFISIINNGIIVLAGDPIITNDPLITGGDGAVSMNSGSKMDAAGYTGGDVTLKLVRTTLGDVIVENVTEANRDKFIVTNRDCAIELTDEGTLVMVKATPTADIFDFTPPENLDYMGIPKEANITVKEGIEGVGSVTVTYLKDGEPFVGIPTDIGTYTVMIDVVEGANFKSVKELTSDNWTFTISESDIVYAGYEDYIADFDGAVSYFVEGENISYQWYATNSETKDNSVMIRGGNSAEIKPLILLAQRGQETKYKYFYCVSYTQVNGVTVKTESPVIINAFALLKETPSTYLDFQNMVIYSDSKNNVNSFANVLTVENGAETAWSPSYTCGDTKSYGTGSVLTLGIRELNKSQFKLIVYGDVNGDGVVDVLDCTETLKASNLTTTLEGDYAIAADINEDGNIDVLDYQLSVNKAVS